jgi:hypothetical protein
MKPPSRTDMQLGTPVGLAMTGVATFIACFAWMGGSVPWLVPAFCLLLLNAARKAKVRVEAYQRWRAEWDGMAGGQGVSVLPTPGERGTLRPREETAALSVKADATATKKPRAGTLLLVAWALLLFWLMTHTSHSAPDVYAAAALLWLLLSAVGAFALLFSVARGLARLASRERQGGTHSEGGAVVRVCLPVPRDVPSPRALFAALPDYCKPLLRPPE